MIKKVTVKGQYVGNNKRGIVVGGMLFKQNAPAITVQVTEDTYKNLLQGKTNGWFKILSDNYASFCLSRKNAATGTFNTKSEMVETDEVAAAMPEAQVMNEVAEEVVEEVKETEAKKATKKTTKKAKAEDKNTDNE